MSNADLAAWVSVAVGVLSLIVAIVSLWKSKQNAAKVHRLEATINILAQSAVNDPTIATGGGGGGGFGGGRGGDGGSVNYQPIQVSNVRQD